MTLGATFTLIHSQGEQEMLLNNLPELRRRVAVIIKNSGEYTQEDIAKLPSFMDVKRSVLPSLNAVQKTHYVFVHNTYKCYVPISYEYLKKSYAKPSFGSTVRFTLDKVGHYIYDIVLHLRLTGLSAVDPRDRVRYVAMLGHRMAGRVRLTVDESNIIDEYTSDEYNRHYQFNISADQETAWLRAMGQEMPYLGYITPDPTFDMYREYRWIGDGNQTLKQKHDTVDLFIPMLFWFCEDVKNALSTHLMCDDKLQIHVDLPDVSSIIGYADYGGGGAYNAPTIGVCDLYINHIFTVPEIAAISHNKFEFSLIRVHKQFRKTLTTAGPVHLDSLRFLAEALYVSFVPHANIQKSQQWYKTCRLTEKTCRTPIVAKNPGSTVSGTISTATASTAILVAGGLSPVDGTYAAYDFVITSGTGYNAADITKNRYYISAYVGATQQITITTAWTGPIPDGTTTFEMFTPQLAINLITYSVEEPVVDSIALAINGIEIYRQNPEMLYHHMVGVHSYKHRAPPERGQYFMPFGAHVGHHQPNGNLNLSMFRDVYLHFESQHISPEYPVELIVCERAINWIVFESKTMQLRYAV